MSNNDPVVQRHRYLDQIIPFIGKPVTKILVGMRRVGKSELLRQIARILEAKSSDHKLIYVNKELRQYDWIQTHTDLNQHIDNCNATKGSAILIDEVQEIASWEKSVSSYLAEGMDVYITGSNAHLLSSDLATLLSGRYIEFPVYTLSFAEFIELGEVTNRFPRQTREEAFRRYLKFGGLPGLCHLDADETAAFQYLDAIYSTILLKDVVKRHNIRHVGLLENISQYVFDNIGNLFNANSVSKYLRNQRIENSLPTVQSHVRYLAETFITHRARQYDLKGKRYLEINDKYFVGDLGIRHAILGYRESDIGCMLENIVFLELLRRNYRVSIGRIGDKEVDFIAQKENIRIYIQVAYLMPEKNIVEREFAALEAIKDNFPKYVISMDPIPIERSSGILHLNLFDFLLSDHL